jgi:TIR domain
VPSTSPFVFISYATSNEAQARDLADALEAYGIKVFVAVRDIPVAGNFVITIQETIVAADYFVLLLSRDAVEREWVNLEWTTALARDVNEQRAFLFVVRLDSVDLPTLLSTRQYLDARRGVTSVVPDLVRAWRLDVRSALDGLPRRPAPHIETDPDLVFEETVAIYVMNRDLGVEHLLRVPRRLSCRQLHARVRTALDLPSSSPALGGRIVLRYRYQLLHGDQPLRTDSDECVELFDETTLDMAVVVELPHAGEERSLPTVVYRDRPDITASYRESELVEIERQVLTDFHHLLP